MPAIATVTGQLLAGPSKPVLCLDTCDLLEIVQCFDWEKANTPRPVECIGTARHLLDELTRDPDCVQLVITELVEREWTQNITAIREKSEAFLTSIDRIVGSPYRAAELLGQELSEYDSLAKSNLVADLVGLSTELLNRAAQLDPEYAFTQLALGRVMDNRRPSHEGHIKDSINFEHYLAFARSLRAGGFSEEVVFVSKNRRDYWDGAFSRIHPDLQPEIADPAARLTFFGSLASALGFLRI